MGYFRRFKLSDYTAAQCRREIQKREHYFESSTLPPLNAVRQALDEWACFRELLARHENQNKSQLDN